MKDTKEVVILHLYPEELNMYGDRGNILTLVQRLKWRGYQPIIRTAGVDDQVDIAKADIIFGGGGQDRGQLAVGKDLQRHAAALRNAAAGGVPMLVICGTYQLFGHGFTTLEGTVIPGISIFQANTIGSSRRMIGNAIIESSMGRLVGFENHSGRTLLKPGQPSLGTVSQGFGNDGSSGNEGAVTNQVYGTYLHGPVLPKNPVLADHLIALALERKFGIQDLEPLDDELEKAAAAQAASRPQ
ncbi:MAG TPA: glutamine amidotransferase [Candidatus Saccharimonadia bacterium]